MNLERKIYETRAEKQKDFAIGVGVFLGLNVLLFILSLAVTWLAVALTENSTSEVATSIPFIANCLLYPLTFLINIALLVYFILTRTWIGIGMLGTFGFLLLLGTVLGVIASVVCFATMGSGL